ncbi:MAG TPA: HAD-IA family hydrolase [Longimicrobiaceae bacterium]|nr:HAD-IA family hydrolase [Longimicrobiaceae bacterium]
MAPFSSVARHGASVPRCRTISPAPIVREAIGEVPPQSCICLCPHTPEDGCDCRKPAPGMLLDIMRHFGIAGDETLSIGDTENDCEAARRAGVRFV